MPPPGLTTCRFLNAAQGSDWDGSSKQQTGLLPCRVAVLSASRVVPSRSARKAGEARAADAAATQAPQLRLRVAELERELLAKHVSTTGKVLGARQ